VKIRSLILIFSATTLAGCAGTETAEVAQSLFADRVRKESDSRLCLTYLSERRILSNQAREIEIERRNLDCSTVISTRDIEIERRLRDAERTADQANERSSRLKLCAQGLKAFCH
jgi:hypothetical protein